MVDGLDFWVDGSKAVALRTTLLVGFIAFQSRFIRKRVVLLYCFPIEVVTKSFHWRTFALLGRLRDTCDNDLTRLLAY